MNKSELTMKNMSRWVVALNVATGIFLLGATLVVALPKEEAYKHDGKGLAKQFEPFLKAYAKGDAAAQDEAFKVFQFPDAKAWFGEYFRAKDVQQLVWDGEAEVDREKIRCER